VSDALGLHCALSRAEGSDHGLEQLARGDRLDHVCRDPEGPASPVRTAVPGASLCVWAVAPPGAWTVAAAME